MRPLRFALVGAGAIARAYARVFAGWERARIVAVADVDAMARSTMASQLGCEPYRSAASIPTDGLDAALICTPPSTHAALACGFLARGVSVLCEKPLALDRSSARRMLEAAHASGSLLAMAAKFRYVADLMRAREIVGSGVLGELVLFENAFTSVVPMAGRWNADPARSGGGVLIDNGTHSVDIVRYLVGPIVEVNAVEGHRVQRLDVEDTVSMHVRTAEGVVGGVELSWSVDRRVETFVDVYGSEGSLGVGWRGSQYRRSGDDDWVVFGSGYDKLACMRREVANFCEALRGEAELLITDDDALASVEVIEAAYRSLRRSAWVPVGSEPVERVDAPVP